MDISKMEKEVNFNTNEVKITVVIKVDHSDMQHFDYEGFDMLPDEAIPDLLIAAAKIHKNKMRLLSLVKE